MHVLVTLTLHFRVSYYSKGTKNTYWKGDYHKQIWARLTSHLIDRQVRTEI